MKIKDIANLAGVSTATVSRVINNSIFVKDDTRLKIENIIKKTDYRPNVLAQNLARNQSGTIGVVIPDLNNPYFGKIIKGISQKLDAQGLNFILLDSDASLKKEKKNIRTLIEQKIKGVIVAPVSNDKLMGFDHFNQLAEQEIPYVFIDREVEGIKTSSIHPDNKNSAYSATKFLLKKTDYVTMISGPQKITTAIRREEGYRLAMRDSGLEEIVYYGDYRMESGYKIILEILKREKLPRALFIANNMMSLGVIKGLLENGVKISEDISLFSFDEVEMANAFGIKINYFKFDVKSIGEKAVELLKSKFDGNKGDKTIRIFGKIKIAE